MKPKSNLKDAVSQLSKCKTQDEKIHALNKAFELFSIETSRLESEYEILKVQFKAVNNELEDANIALNRKVLQLDTITRYLNGIITNISQGILFVDLSGTITTYNHMAEQLLDEPPLKVLLCQFWDHFSDDLFGFSMKESLATKKAPNSIISSVKTSSGAIRDLEINTKFVISPYTENNSSEMDPLENIQGLIILIRDLTRIRYLQTLANRNDRMKELGEMAAMLAHEIRNPLGGIKGYASLLQRDLKDSPVQQQMADYIVEGTENLNQLVTHVLNYSRPFKAEFEQINVFTLIDDILHHLQADKMMKENIEIQVKSPFKELSFPADPQLLKSAILNLVMNAIQAMPNGGKIEIEIGQTKTNVVIKIKDSGVGISKENLEKIFTPFFTTKIDGNGLGLCEAHKVIQAHAGKLEAASELNQGTTFTIEMPLRVFAGK
jgi:signal transduction histidine kinase